MGLTDSWLRIRRRTVIIYESYGSLRAQKWQQEFHDNHKSVF